MKFAVSVSNNATRIIKILKKLHDINSPLLKEIEFIIIDNINCENLRTLCEELGIQLFEVDLKNIEENKNTYISDKILDLLQKHNVDFLFLFSCTLLKGQLLEEYKNKIINFHPSLLPSYKGFNAIDQALDDNAPLIGNTAHIVNNNLDGGAIIMQSFLKREQYKTYDDVLDMQIPMFVQLISWIDKERLIFENEKALIDRASYKQGSFVPNIEINNL